ncbi:MAG: hypothetical protein LBT30_05330 [Clostridiales bacterium]|nr:hypothetical protein [Clostridiales bacterium]
MIKFLRVNFLRRVGVRFEIFLDYKNNADFFEKIVQSKKSVRKTGDFSCFLKKITGKVLKKAV